MKTKKIVKKMLEEHKKRHMEVLRNLGHKSVAMLKGHKAESSFVGDAKYIGLNLEILGASINVLEEILKRRKRNEEEAQKTD